MAGKLADVMHVFVRLLLGGLWMVGFSPHGILDSR